MSDFSSYLFNPFAPDTVAKLEQYPEFQFKNPKKSAIIAYLCLVYDHNSDLTKLYPDNLSRRKREAALQAGFKIGADKKFPQDIEDIMVCQNPDFNKALVRYSRLFGIADLPSYNFYTEALFSEIESGYACTDSKVKKTIIENVEKTRTILSQLERKMFSGEESVELRNELYRVAENERLGLRPEEIARSIANKTLELPDPQKMLARGNV